jgi:hypothetical protein
MPAVPITPPAVSPLVYTMKDLRLKHGFSRRAAAALVHMLGRKVGTRWLVSRERLEWWFAQSDAPALSLGGATRAPRERARAAEAESTAAAQPRL